MSAEWVEGEALRALEPALGPRVLGAVYTKDDLNVDPGLVTQAIGRAAERAGVDVRTGVSVSGFRRRGGRGHGVATSAGTVDGGCGRAGGGAVDGALSAKLGFPLKTPPMRGQMLAYRTTKVRHAIWGEDGYLVPKTGRLPVRRGDGGGRGLPQAHDEAGTGGPAGDGGALAPVLRHAEVASAWAGLRPGSEDGWPVIGRLPTCENAYVATGHFRNGILLAPVTGKAVAQMVLEGGTEVEGMAAFGAERFLRLQRASPMSRGNGDRRQCQRREMTPAESSCNH